MLEIFTDNDFENKIKKDNISICQFSAAYCAPCKSLKPLMDKFSETYKDKAQNWFYCDVEEGAINLGSQMFIKAVPTIIIFKKGVEVDRLTGNPGEAAVKEFLDKNI
tara:strand:+ start:537 stop:857 length:321 start_codon:yes stop_codon:yes gene_type:complete